MKRILVLLAIVASVLAIATILQRQMRRRADQTTAQTAEIEALEEWVESAESTHERVHARFMAGTHGGEAEQESLTRYQMCIAKARLASAKGDLGECEKWYKAAVDAAEKGVEAQQAAYDVGVVTLNSLLLRQQYRAEAKIKLSEARDRITPS